MQIVHLVTLVDEKQSYGGPLTVAVNHCQQLQARGHGVTLLAGWQGRDTSPTSIEGVPAKLFPTRLAVPGNRFSGLIAPGLNAWLRENKASIDVAHVHLARDLIPLSASRTLRAAQIPYVTQTHGMVVPDARLSARIIDRLLTRPALANAGARLVLTEDESASLSVVLGPGQTITALGNGIPFLSPSAPSDLKDCTNVLFLARLHPRKRVKDFLAAADLLANHPSKPTFSIVGVDSGDLFAVNDFITSNRSLAGRIKYEGSLSHEAAVERIRRSDIYVLPSINEPYPMSLIEAIAIGVPTVSTTQTGLARLIEENQAGIVVAPSPSAIADGIKKLLESAELRETTAARGRELAAASLNIEAIIDQLEMHYRHAIQSKASREGQI